MDMAGLAFLLQPFVVYMILVHNSAHEAGMPNLFNRLEDRRIMERAGVAQDRHASNHHRKHDDEVVAGHERRFRH